MLKKKTEDVLIAAVLVLTPVYAASTKLSGNMFLKKERKLGFHKLCIYGKEFLYYFDWL
jgi:hypothetical protein